MCSPVQYCPFTTDQEDMNPIIRTILRLTTEEQLIKCHLDGDDHVLIYPALQLVDRWSRSSTLAVQTLTLGCVSWLLT